jgi:uncharacterized protein
MEGHLMRKHHRCPPSRGNPIAGLVLGGVLAAPFAALVARRLPARPLMVIVGVVVSLLALRSLLASLRALAGES